MTWAKSRKHTNASLDNIVTNVWLQLCDAIHTFHVYAFKQESLTWTEKISVVSLIKKNKK